VELALENHEPSVITTYTHTLCQKFNHYFHKFPVIAEENEQKKQLRLQLILLLKRTLEKLFTIMGIPVPEMM
jgi:arginyl-tRNA synthetase